MSTLKVDAIRHNSATSDAITTAADGTCTAQISSLNDSYIGGRRNMIINGDHRIAQRGTAAVTVTTSAQYRCVDRFKSDIDGSSGGDFSHAQSTDVPAGQGFTHSSKITTVTQVSQPSGTSNRHQLYTMLEKQDVAHLEWGTSAAKTCTLSFWVKSSVTGTYILWFRHYGGTTHSYYTNYTINSANTWEKKTITITGYTSNGNVSGTTDQGILIEWNLGTSSGNETGTLNEWTTSGTIRAASGSVYLPENAGATWYLTGCQFEVGSVMTPFEHRSIEEELARCQRYCEVITHEQSGQRIALGHSEGNNVSENFYPTKQVMRAIPTYTFSGSENRRVYERGAAIPDVSACIVEYSSTCYVQFGVTVAATQLTNGNANVMYWNGTPATPPAKMILSAEL